MSKIILMVGCPGSGKSTFLKKYANDGQIISRDAIRFDLLAEDDDYFAKEEEVFKAYIDFIQSYLDKDVNVYADATHLNERSRNKLLDNLDLSKTSLNAIVFLTPLEECLKRNAGRTGRARVPDNVLTDMYNRYRDPKEDKKYNYENVLYVRD